jgi:hypothetical protein
MELDQIAERLQGANSTQQGMAIMLAKKYLQDPSPVQTRAEFIKGISKELAISEELMEWGFKYVESGGSILLLKKDNGHTEDTRRSRTSKEDRAKH